MTFDEGRNSPLQRLQGLSVATVVSMDDYIQLVFSAGTILNVYNNHSSSPGTVHALSGRVVTAVAEAEDRVIFTFEDGSSLFVNMLAGDYNGPESMELLIDGEPIVVWS